MAGQDKEPGGPMATKAMEGGKRMVRQKHWCAARWVIDDLDVDKSLKCAPEVFLHTPGEVPPTCGRYECLRKAFMAPGRAMGATGQALRV